MDEVIYIIGCLMLIVGSFGIGFCIANGHNIGLLPMWLMSGLVFLFGVIVTGGAVVVNKDE
jgi:hypothetical protein